MILYAAILFLCSIMFSLGLLVGRHVGENGPPQAPSASGLLVLASVISIIMTTVVAANYLYATRICVPSVHFSLFFGLGG